MRWKAGAMQAEHSHRPRPWWRRYTKASLGSLFSFLHSNRQLIIIPRHRPILPRPTALSPFSPQPLSGQASTAFVAAETIVRFMSKVYGENPVASTLPLQCPPQVVCLSKRLHTFDEENPNAQDDHRDKVTCEFAQVILAPVTEYARTLKLCLSNNEATELVKCFADRSHIRLVQKIQCDIFDMCPLRAERPLDPVNDDHLLVPTGLMAREFDAGSVVVVRGADINIGNRGRFLWLKIPTKKAGSEEGYVEWTKHTVAICVGDHTVWSISCALTALYDGFPHGENIGRK